MNLSLPYSAPYDWQQVLAFLASRAIEGVEEVEDGCYRRSIQIGSVVGVLTVTQSPHRLALHAHIGLETDADLEGLDTRLRRLFDLDANRTIINQHLQSDPWLNTLIKERPGLCVPGAWDIFELVVRAILGQQISVKAARTLAGRLVQRYGTPLRAKSKGKLSHLFPTAETLATADLDGLGITRRRVEYIQRVSQVFADDELLLGDDIDLETIQKTLCKLPGIGPWTAQYIAMRALSRSDAFPEGDLVLIQKMQLLSGKSCDKKELQQYAENWRPYRAYAALHLWHWKAN